MYGKEKIKILAAVDNLSITRFPQKDEIS